MQFRIEISIMSREYILLPNSRLFWGEEGGKINTHMSHGYNPVTNNTPSNYRLGLGSVAFFLTAPSSFHLGFKLPLLGFKASLAFLVGTKAKSSSEESNYWLSLWQQSQLTFTVLRVHDQSLLRSGFPRPTITHLACQLASFPLFPPKQERVSS